MKKIMSIVASMLIVLLLVLLLWRLVIIRREAPAIKTVVYAEINARKIRDVEGMYEQMLPVEEGGIYKKEGLERGLTTWGQLFFEEYNSVEVKVTQVIRDEAIVRGKFFYENCDIWFKTSLVRTAEGWKIYKTVMPMHPDNLACIGEK